MSESPKRGLRQRLDDDAVICAEGYLFELERRGYLQAGAFVPQPVLEFPDAVKQLHREFMRAGSDIIEAFTYYGHREKLRLIGMEDKLEPLQLEALALAKQVAAEAEGEPPLVAGNICNTNLWEDESSAEVVRPMFDEQVAWAKEAGVDLIIGETFSHLGEARVALDSIKRVGLPAVITLILHQEDRFRDGFEFEEGAKMLEDGGADVVGLNCGRGPATILEPIRRIRRAVSCHVGVLPVPFRTRAEQPTFQSLRDPGCGCIPDDRPFPTALDPFTCNRYEMAEFARAVRAEDIRYIGVCCGGAPHHVRSIAEALGRQPPASAYSPDMSKHFAFGTDKKLKQFNRDYADKL